MTFFLSAPAHYWHGDELPILFNPPGFDTRLTQKDAAVKAYMADAFTSLWKSGLVELFRSYQIRGPTYGLYIIDPPLTATPMPRRHIGAG